MESVGGVTSGGQGVHDFWVFEGLLSNGNDKLHVTAYNEPIATELVQNARRCISLHVCTDTQAKVSETHPMGIIQIGGLDRELRNIVLEEFIAAGIPAENATDDDLKGEEAGNIGNKTQLGGCVQLEWGGNTVPACSGPTRGRGGKIQRTPSFGHWSARCVSNEQGYRRIKQSGYCELQLMIVHVQRRMRRSSCHNAFYGLI